MAIHFFTEVELDGGTPKLTQTPGNEFGPISNLEFNLSSMHSWSDGNYNPKAIACLKGQILYQQDADPTLLNAILKISDSTGLNDLPLKYIVYRGILKSSLLQSETMFQNIQDEGHIVKKILEEDAPNDTNYLSLGLGITSNSNPGTDEVYVSNDADLDLLLVKAGLGVGRTVRAGDVLGEFQAIKFGVDVIQESGWKKPKVDILRNISISVGNRITINTNDSAAKIRANKEAILNYIDPACLFSLFYHLGIKTTLGTELLDSADVHDKILHSFRNKNKIYLDIRNDNDLSFNYYGNYPHIYFRDSLNNDDPQNQQYETSDWPIHIVNVNNVKIHPGEQRTEVPLALPTAGNTLNILFAVHAAKYRPKQDEPLYLQDGARFSKLRKDRGEPTRTNYLNLSTFRNPTGNAAVCSYFRLFYAKQWEEQDLASTVVSSNHILDNLFTVENIAYYEERLDGAMSHWLTGRMMYIPRKLPNVLFGSYIDYPGMYYAGIAIDNFSITFYAIPFAINRKRKDVVPPVALPESSEVGFLQTLISSGSGDLKIEKFAMTDPQEGNIHILNIYNRPVNPEVKKFDEEAFVGLSLTRAQYSAQISSQLSGFDYELHPIFLKVKNNSYVNSGQVTRKELVLTGYNNQAALKTEDVSSVYFYFLGKKMGRFGHTAAVANEIQFAELIAEFEIPTGFVIGHSENGPPEERKKFQEIVMALKLVKSFMKEEFDEVVRLMGTPQLDRIPQFRVIGDQVGPIAGSNRVFHKTEERLRQYSIEIRYMIPNPSPGPNEIHIKPDEDGKTISTPIMAKSIDLSSDVEPPPFPANTDITQVVTGEKINKDEYEQVAVHNTQATPKQIEENYIPKIKTRIEDPNQPGATTDSELVAYNEIPGKERAIYESDYLIILNENIRTQYSSDELKFQIITSSGVEKDENFKGEFEGLSKLLVQISSIIAHELGHVVAHIDFPVLVTAWRVLEKNYTESDLIQPNDPNLPSFRGEGHLEGSPEGNLTGRYEYKFSKTLVQDGLWPAAIQEILKAGSKNNQIKQIIKLKKEIAPYYTEKIESDPIGENSISFKIRNYINGNLGMDEVELPPPTKL